MATKVYVDDRLKNEPKHDALAETYVGQAHIAGTGPKGKLCHECAYWGKNEAQSYERYGYRADCKNPGRLKDGQCHKVFPQKVYQLFPADAKSCMFFEQAPAPQKLVVEKPE